MIKDVKIQALPQCTDYYCRELGNSLEVVSRQDLLDIEKKYLKKFNTTSLGANSKVYFSEYTDFPRYRLRDYGKDKNITITRDISKADVVVADKKSFRKTLDQCYGYNQSNQGLRGLSCHKWRGNMEYVESAEVNTRLSCYDEVLGYTGKVIDILDLTKVVCAGRMIWDCEQAINIDRMLDSSVQDDCDLALEMIANSDLEENMVKNYLLLCNHYYSNRLVRDSTFTHSVNFKTVASYYGNLGLTYYDYACRDICNVLSWLKSRRTEFTPSDIELVDHYVQKQFKSQFGADIIDELDIKYNLPIREFKEETQETFSFTGIPRDY